MKIIMTDIDGVILNTNYQLTPPSTNIKPKLISSSSIIIPNSDTPILRIQNIFLKSLGIKPETAIGEKGAVVLLNNVKHYLAKITGIQEFLLKLREAFRQTNCQIYFGDSATWIQMGRRFNPNQRLLIIDQFREQTVGFYLRCSDQNGRAVINQEWFEIGKKIIQSLSIPSGLLANDFNSEYGIVIMSAANVDKTTGYEFLRQHFFEAKFFMIGDGNSDIIKSKNVVHCAVANASERLKQVSKFVANNKFTTGWIECLEWIAIQ